MLVNRDTLHNLVLTHQLGVTQPLHLVVTLVQPQQGTHLGLDFSHHLMQQMIHIVQVNTHLSLITLVRFHFKYGDLKFNNSENYSVGMQTLYVLKLATIITLNLEFKIKRLNKNTVI